MPRCVTFRVGSEWTALYVDGKLDTIGDSYLADQRIAEIYGVEFRESPIMARIDQRSQAPATLHDLSQLERAWSDKQFQAQQLRAEAERLLSQADALTKES